MPLHIDEEWEYHVPDQEIAEIVYAHKGSNYDNIYDARNDIKKGGNPGFRFGRGNPNKCCFRLGREKKARFIEPPVKKICLKCKCQFTTKRKKAIFCSRKCGCGNIKTLPLWLDCERCKTPFAPRVSIQKFCSLKCASATGIEVVKDDYKALLDGVSKKLSEMVNNGRTNAAIAATLKVSIPTIKRWKREIGLVGVAKRGRPKKGGLN